MLQIKPEIDSIIENGGKVAVCVAAKPNKDAYDQSLEQIGYALDELIILGREDSVHWSEYSAVVLLGGSTRELYVWLQKTDFSLDLLKKCLLLAGDSAGAYVLGAKVLIDYEKDGSSFEIADGYMPDSKVLVAAHVNNSHYHLPGLSEALGHWCAQHKIDLLELEENEISPVTL